MPNPRRINRSDLEALSNVNYLPSPNNIIAAGTIGNVIGFIEIFAEASIVFKDRRGLRRDIENLREIFSLMKDIAKHRNIENMYVFVDEDFAKILKKHFGFEDCKGIPLVLRMNHGKESETESKSSGD